MSTKMPDGSIGIGRDERGWFAIVTLREHKWESDRFRTEAEAEAKAEEIKAELRKHAHIVPRSGQW